MEAPLETAAVLTTTPSGAWTVLSPLVMTMLLMRVSGVALLERKLTETRPEYAAYCRRVNAFVPWFPRRGPAPTRPANTR